MYEIIVKRIETGDEDFYECRCDKHVAFWREVLADQRYQDFKDELPYAN